MHFPPIPTACIDDDVHIVDTSDGNFAAVFIEMNPETGAPSGWYRTQLLSLMYSKKTGEFAGCLTVNGFFREAVIECPYGAVFRGKQSWGAIEDFLKSEVLQ